MPNKLTVIQPLRPIDFEIANDFIANYNGSTGTHVRLLNVNSSMRNSILVNNGHLLAFINTNTNIQKIVIFICQVDPNTNWYVNEFAYFNTQLNQIKFLFSFLDEHNRFVPINGSYYFDFEEVGSPSYRALTNTQANDFFGRFTAGGQILHYLNQGMSQQNTRAFSFSVNEYRQFIIDLQGTNFSAIKMVFSEIDIYAPILIQYPDIQLLFQHIHKQFNPIFYPADLSGTVLDDSPYDINDLCPPNPY